MEYGVDSELKSGLPTEMARLKSSHLFKLPKYTKKKEHSIRFPLMKEINPNKNVNSGQISKLATQKLKEASFNSESSTGKRK